MICWTRSRNPQAGFRFPAHGSTDTGPAGRRSRIFSYAMLPDAITSRSAMIDCMAQSFRLFHKRCEEREPGTTRTARGQQTAQSIKILRRLHVRSCLHPLGIIRCRSVQCTVWMKGSSYPTRSCVHRVTAKYWPPRSHRVSAIRCGASWTRE
jgi:hypothetical protein